MTFDDLLKQLPASQDSLSKDLIDGVKASEVAPVLPGPGSESAGSLHATFTIRARTSAAAGIKTVGLQTVLSHLETLNPVEQVLLFHFSSQRRVFSVFVRERDSSILGILSVDR